MRRRTLSSTSVVRSYNVAAVLQTLHRAGSCSRAELTELTRMSPSTVSRITAQLIKRGIIVEERLGSSTGGRPPVMLRLDYEKLYVIGVLLLRDRVSLGIFDLNGQAIHKHTYVPYALDPEFLIRELHDRIDELLTAAEIRKRSHVLGVGLAVAGVVRSEDGTVSRSVNLGWRDVPIARMLEDRLALPVLAENDANAGALAEMWFGGAADGGNVMYVKTDAGVGAGLIFEQQLITGPRGMAGEIGHIPFVADGHPCRCGQRGCLETYVSMPDVLRRYAATTGRDIDKATFFDSARKSDDAAVRLIDEAKSTLTLALTAATAMLDLDMVVVDGVWGRFNPGFLADVQTGVQQAMKRTGLDKHVTVQPSRLGEDSDLLGAVGLVTNRLFSPPDVLAAEPGSARSLARRADA